MYTPSSSESTTTYQKQTPLSSSSSHQRREIKIPQVDSVHELLNPTLSSIPKDLNILIQKLQEMISTSSHPHPIEDPSSEQIKLDDSFTHIQLCSYLEIEPKETVDSSVYDINNDDHIKEPYDILNECFSTKCIKYPNEYYYNNELEPELFTTNNHYITEEIIDLSQQILNKVNIISDKMNKYQIKTSDLFKNTTKTYSILDKNKKNSIIKIVNTYGAKKTANALNLSIKSLKRWLKNGTERKKGGGRKILDPEMEKNVVKWYNEQIMMGRNICAKEIKAKAKQLSKCDFFLASKGWFEKFKKKYHIVPYIQHKKHSTLNNN